MRQSLLRHRSGAPRCDGDESFRRSQTFSSSSNAARRRRCMAYFLRPRIFLFLVLISVCFIALLTVTIHTIANRDDPGAMLSPVRGLIGWLSSQRVEGVRETLLSGVSVVYRQYSPEQLLQRYGDIDFVYSFVNGTEVNHVYRRTMLASCGDSIHNAEMRCFKSDKHFPTLMDVCNASNPFGSAKTGGELLRVVSHIAGPSASNRDRETDELRHSMRSIEQHIRWHRGRVVIVSPGHHPQWVDVATNFLSSSCGGAPAAAAREDGAHVRVTTVHQDAVMPYGLKLTMNSHVIEQHLWRVKNITSVHVYFNDDYFVNRDVAITDFFNEYGGTIVRSESSTMNTARRSDAGGASWKRAVQHTTLFNVMELDERPQDYISTHLLHRWANLSADTGDGGVGSFPPIDKTPTAVPVTPIGEWWSVPERFPPEGLPDRWITFGRKSNSKKEAEVELAGGHMRRRHFSTHAPFTYCTNMFRFLNARYESIFAYNAMHHRTRSSSDLLSPFVYNAFIMARPWQASPQFLPFLWRRALGKADDSKDSLPVPPMEIILDNSDGCAPATELIGSPFSGTLFAKFSDDISSNEEVIHSVSAENPLFFNINAGFKSPEASQQLVKFLSTKFTEPVYVERGASEELRALYDALIGLPVVVLTSFSEGVCPAVRSLQLWLPDHRGSVVGIVQRFGDDSDPALSELRQTLRHRVRSAMPAVACALDSARVRVVEWERERTVADVLSAAGPSAAVPLPASCGVGGSADGSVSVRAIVVDARTASGGVELDARWVRGAVTVPGQTVALEDFDVVRMADGAAVLVLSRAAADAKGVHWIDGASESDLLLTFPLPYPPYEDMLAPVQWVDRLV